MGIYIRGISMPKDGECVVVVPSGVVQKYKAGGIAFYEYQDRTEETVAVQLPPHGRLIDADALLKDHGLGMYCPKCKRDERSCQFEMIHTTMDFCEWIEDAPTIIPADPEEGGSGNV